MLQRFDAYRKYFINPWDIWQILHDFDHDNENVDYLF